MFALQPGYLLNQQYLVQNLLCETQLSQSYAAIDLYNSEKPCFIQAFQVSLHEASVIQRVRVQLQRAALRLSQLRHPQLIGCAAIIEQPQTLLIVQDAVQGKTYRQLLQKRLLNGQLFSEVEILQLITSLLSPLQAIHSQGILHHNICPATLMDLTVGTPALIEFGSLKMLMNCLSMSGLSMSDLHRTGLDKVPSLQASLLVDTSQAGYAPPEQLQGAIIAPHSDLYGLAMTALELLTGNAPHARSHSSHIQSMLQTVSISDRFITILSRMLADEPGDRYQSVRELQTALQPLLEQQAALAIDQTGGQPIAPMSVRSIQLPSLSATQLDLTQAYSPAVRSPKSATSPTVRSRAQQIPRLGLSTDRPRTKPFPRWALNKFQRQRAAIAVSATILAGLAKLSLPATISPKSQGVWISGIQVSRTEASQIIEDKHDPVSSGSDTASTPSSNRLPERLTNNWIGRSELNGRSQAITFAPGQTSATFQEILVNPSYRSYSFTVPSGKIAQAYLQGPRVDMQVQCANQRRAIARDNATQTWTESVTVTTPCLIQIEGSGAYSLNLNVSDSNENAG
ncbi:MAG TPA: protein kinase [Crinalium sp.]